MPFATIIVSGYQISLVGIGLLIFQALITYFMKKEIKGFGIKTSSTIGGWITAAIGMITLTVSGILGLSYWTLVLEGSFTLFAIFAILLTLAARSKLSHYKGIFRVIFIYIPVAGIIAGIIFSILNTILVV